MPAARAFPFAPDPRSCTPNRWPTLERLLSLYLDADLTIADIAFTLFLPIARILELVKRPESVEALKDYEIEHKKRAKHLATCNIDTAARAHVRPHAASKPSPPVATRKAIGTLSTRERVRRREPTSTHNPQRACFQAAKRRP